MIRPTSLWRSWTLKMVIFPGISVSTMSSGNSTNWRMMNSRNSFMADKQLTTKDTNRHEIFRAVKIGDVNSLASLPLALPELRLRAGIPVRVQLQLLAPVPTRQQLEPLQSSEPLLVWRPSLLQPQPFSLSLLPDSCFS